MNGVLKATTQTVSKATVYRLAAAVALGSAATAVGIASLLQPAMGVVAGYVLWPLLVSLGLWLVASVLRLRLVGFLPSQPNDDDFISPALQPWIRFWLLSRFGLLGAMLLLFLAIVATALAGRGVNYCVQALVYVVMVRLLLDSGFGAAFNLGIITRRRGAG